VQRQPRWMTAAIRMDVGGGFSRTLDVVRP
jgi:hypothetical protein